MAFLHGTSLLRASFRNRPVSSCSQLLITKKPVDFDYIALDATGLVGNALRLAKNVTTEQRRQREVGRHVLHSVQQLLKKINCKKSLLIAMDGAETLAKACVTRRSSLTRRLESRLVRLPGTALMQIVEERLVRMMPGDRLHALPSEVVISGTCVMGCVEEKFSAWALDLACREGFRAGSDTLCFIGSSELFLNTLTMTPYFQVSSLVQSTADIKQVSLLSLLEWLELDTLAAKGDSTLVARARTDALFLYLICHGCTATELPPATAAHFLLLWDRYHLYSLQRACSSESSTSVKDVKPNQIGSLESENSSHCLFEDTPGHTLELDLENFIRVLSLDPHAMVIGASGGNSPIVRDKNLDTHSGLHTHTFNPSSGMGMDLMTESYLEHVLQSHAMLCLGYTPNPFYVPCYYDGLSDSREKSVSLHQLVAYVKALLARGVRKLRAKDCSGPKSMSDSKPSAMTSSSPKMGPHLFASGDETGEQGLSKEDGVPVTSQFVSDGVSGPIEKPSMLEDNASPPPSVPVSSQHSLFWTPTQPLTAAEYTLLCQVQSSGIESGLQLYVGAAVKLDLGKRIAQTTDTNAAHRLVQEALSYADPERPHRCLCISPSYCWLQNEKTKLWRMEYVDIGELARERGIRRVWNAVSGVAMKLCASDGGPVCFDYPTQQWQPVLRFPCGSEKAVNNADEAGLEAAGGDSGAAHLDAAPAGPCVPCSFINTVKVLTWNVMFDRYSGQPTPLGMPGIDWCSPQRYPVLSKCIAAEDADVVGMQEVEPAFLDYLAAQPWCRDKYILSCTASSSVIQPWGVLMLVHRRRLPVMGLTHMNVPAWPGHVSLMPIVTLHVAGAPLHVSSAHLLAPFTKAHEHARTAQDLALCQRLVKSIPSSEDCIAMGDFNDYPGNEFVMPSESRYVECWPLLHPHDPGKTMDESNSFCKLKVEEMFFGRSDKVFIRSHRLTPVETHLVGTKSVNAENGDDAAPAYLFPSDHYGVSMTFTIK